MKFLLIIASLHLLTNDTNIK